MSKVHGSSGGIAWLPGSLTKGSRARLITNLPTLRLVNTRTALWDKFLKDGSIEGIKHWTKNLWKQFTSEICLLVYKCYPRSELSIILVAIVFTYHRHFSNVKYTCAKESGRFSPESFGVHLALVTRSIAGPWTGLWDVMHRSCDQKKGYIRHQINAVRQ